MVIHPISKPSQRFSVRDTNQGHADWKVRLAHQFTSPINSLQLSICSALLRFVAVFMVSWSSQLVGVFLGIWLGDKTVSGVTNGQKVFWMRGVAFKSLAQPKQELIDASSLHIPSHVPNLRQ